jgi:hypothetical protein
MYVYTLQFGFLRRSNLAESFYVAFISQSVIEFNEENVTTVVFFWGGGLFSKLLAIQQRGECDI